MTLGKAKSRQNRGNTWPTLSTMRQENNARFARVEAKVEGNTNALEAMQISIGAIIDVLENSKSSLSSGSRRRNEQNSVRAVATGFTVSSTEEEVRELLQGVIKRACDGRKLGRYTWSSKTDHTLALSSAYGRGTRATHTTTTSNFHDKTRKTQQRQQKRRKLTLRHPVTLHRKTQDP